MKDSRGQELKTSLAGLLDVEGCVQAGQLLHAFKDAEVASVANTFAYIFDTVNLAAYYEGYAEAVSKTAFVFAASFRSDLGEKLINHDREDGVEHVIVCMALPDGRIKVSFRSRKHSAVGVRLLAEMLGGGGHHSAASAIIDQVAFSRLMAAVYS